MTETLVSDQIRAGIARIATALIAHANELNRLDAAMGDGDMGVTMRLGATAVLAELDRLGDADLATLLSRAAMAFNRAASSTIGALIATAGMRAGKVAKDDGASTVGLPLLARMVAAAEAGIRERGKAQRGDKTLLDALIPASEALTAAAGAGLCLREAVRNALVATEAGLDAMTALRSKVGRAGWVGERTIGQPDPGATAVVIALRAALNMDA